MIHFRRKRVSNGEIERARAAREDAEERLAHDEKEVIMPLHKIRDANHVTELLDSLINRRAREIRNI